jgi:uncharacterized protein YyaL (SSP411 family)
MTEKFKFTNSLIKESSPYLLQHAHNPVNWHSWNSKTMEKAQQEGKPLLISIGYAACHWCHVMAHESFEDEETAAIMNEHFICVKVDREERPDIDQIYMEAVQAMTGSGGWPLHCFALPNGKPFYGGTYFPKENWEKLLLAVSKEFNQNKQKLVDYADQLTTGLSDPMPIKTVQPARDFSLDKLRDMVTGWKMRFDLKNGGENRAPKFPMPVNLTFLLDYAILEDDIDVLAHLNKTLVKMANGGIYDQIGGGFARYSTDQFWKVPHFEKMLYDNAQLVSIYSRGYQATKNPIYESIVRETIQFLLRDLKDPKGIFYSSLDADSDGEEGKFYTWSLPDLKEILGTDYAFAASIFKFDQEGYWENGRYILLRQPQDSDQPISDKNLEENFEQKIIQIKRKLFFAREERVRPDLDDKSLTSWNGLMVKALADAYQVFGDPDYFDSANQVATFILNNLRNPAGGFFHTYKNGKAEIPGFLEDYAFLNEGLLSLYEASFDESWLREAEKVTNYAIDHFFDIERGFFYFTSKDQKDLITRKFELTDGVIPSSNSTMAVNLFKLSRLMENPEWEEIALEMLTRIEEVALHNAGAFSRWNTLYLSQVYPFYETTILGPDLLHFKEKMEQEYIPNMLISGSSIASDIPILIDRFIKDKTVVYVCKDKVCGQPTENIELALKTLKEG